MSNNDENKFIDLSEIPSKNGRINWKNSVGSTVKFRYEEIYGEFKIIEYKDRYLLITYENKKHRILSSHLAECKIGRVIGYRNYGWNYNIGDIINTASGKIKLTGKFTNKYRVKCYNYKCLECGHVSNKEQRSVESSCPSCINQVVTIGFNDMWTTNPKLASCLLNKEDGYKYVVGSNIELDWVCPDCNNIIYSRSPAYMSNYNFPCNGCSKYKSYPNKFIYFLLKYFKIEFEDEAIFDWSDRKRYDFYIPSFNMIIEAQGKGHYEDSFVCFGGRTAKEEQENDKYKESLANNNGISNYIYINCIKSDPNWIKESILNSKLSIYLDFSSVNWLHIDMMASRDYAKEICDLWNNGEYNTYLIADKVGVKYSTVNTCLNKYDKLGILNYDKSKFKSDSMRKASKAFYKPIICTNTNQSFESLATCEKLSKEVFGVNILQSCLSVVLNGKQSKTKGFTFQYITRSEFNTIKSQSPELAYGDYFILPEEPNLANNFIKQLNIKENIK